MLDMDIEKIIDPANYICGVMVARFQIDELHKAHKDLIDTVIANHKKVIIFLGVSNVPNTKKNPLDFATRKAMLQSYVPSAIILPLKDNRSDYAWSSNLDNFINLSFGDTTALLYGSRDSFIPHYHGKHATVELISETPISGTDIRGSVAKEVIQSKDFRAGAIYANYAQRAVTYPTVDVVAYNGDGKLLLAKKPNEKLLRFVGGFVDREDTSYEHSARREFREETGGNCEIGNLKYVASTQVDDWRYRSEESGIMTTLFIGPHQWGNAIPSDDIAELTWVDIVDLSTDGQIENKIMAEHRGLMKTLLKKLRDGSLGIDSLELKLKDAHEG